ncbi:hypothetical protein [Zhihengliuella halotolerans]|uniref:hypothetical protein n=1 Tax=Zhihengliuella halotolerans TaxID=370736 RepID=UPI000C80218A|nr:hypothetical protein [Zhihengliuella halotolerans]
MKSHILYAAIGALWGALVFFAVFLIRNAIGDQQPLGDQSIMLGGTIIIGAVAMAVGHAQRSRKSAKQAEPNQGEK